MSCLLGQRWAEGNPVQKADTVRTGRTKLLCLFKMMILPHKVPHKGVKIVNFFKV
jgi:hypothetical protein